MAHSQNRVTSFLNRKLVQAIVLSWLGFLLVGWTISWAFAAPTTTVLIDRSFCPEEQWQQVAREYETLYQQHRQKSLRIEQVIVFSSLGEETFAAPPTPEAVQSFNTYGQSDPQRQQQLIASHPEASVLGCDR
mgnify:CR=1 FL=1